MMLLAFTEYALISDRSRALAFGSIFSYCSHIGDSEMIALT